MGKTLGKGERAIRNYALHLALILRRQGNLLSLCERYDDGPVLKRSDGR
jgi:hypothetical protein